MSSRRISNILFFAAFVGVAVFSAVLLFQNYQQLQASREQERIAAIKLDDLKRKSDERQLALNQLDADKSYIEKTIRKKLGYAKEGEVVFRFE